MRKVLIIGANSYIGKSFQKYITSYYSDDMEQGCVIKEKITKEEILKEDIRRDYIQENMTINLISASNGAWKQEDFSLYDVVLHLSGIVHRKETDDMEELYDKVNHRLAVAIANKAKENSVKQFILMSTAAVFGSKETHITIDTKPNPTTFYGKSKLAAEQDISKLQSKEFLVAIIRPPMVYGEGCKGNYPKLVKLAKLTPIFPKLHNKRSMIYIDTLCEFLHMLIEQEGSGYYHPQDKDYVDTCELVVKIRKEMGKKTWLIGMFNSPIRQLTKQMGSLDKMFGDCYYDKKLI